MTVEDDARAAVAAELDRLREAFGPFPVVETTVENTPDYYAHGLAIIREHGWLAGGEAVVRDPDGRVLCIRHPDDPERWWLPGGQAEGNERLEETAVREVREETSIDCAVTGVRHAWVKTAEHAGEDRSFPVLTLRFDAEGTGEPSAADDDEVLAARWLDALPAHVTERGP